MSSDEDVRSVVTQGTSHAKRSHRLQIGGSQCADTEVLDEEDLSDGPRISKISCLARHLLHSSSVEKDGALKDVVAQKLYYLTKKEYPSVLRQTSKSLERCFGCKVVHRSSQSQIIRMEYSETNHTYGPMTQAKKGLLSAILMFIFACKSKKTNVFCITEAALLSFLKALGLNYEDPDPIFGDIKKLIAPTHTAEFIHQGYISFSKSSDRYETQLFTYDWGPRATLVCEPSVLLNSFCSIMKDPQVDKWPNQTETMKQLVEEKKQIMINSEKFMCDS